MAQKTVHKVQMTYGKRQIIQKILQEYDIETAEAIQYALKDLLGGTIKEMLVLFYLLQPELPTFYIYVGSTTPIIS